MKSKLRTTIFLSIVFSVISAHIYAAVIYVNHSAAGTNNGTSWTEAFTDLNAALSIATSGDEIWVAQGVYNPSEILDLNASGGDDTREAVYIVPNGITLYGGFTGTELSVEERNWEANPTILSGDIDNNDLNADFNSIAESTNDIVGNNAYHVLYTENSNTDTRIDGFIITAGSASIAVPVDFNDANLDGGGLYNKLTGPSFSSSPTIANTKFHGNFATSEGGAIYNTPGPAGGEIISGITNCLFSKNKADNTGGAIYLGSFSAGNYQPHLTGCNFVWNEAFRRGGAVYLVGDHAQFDSVLFSDNKVTAISDDASTLPGSGGAVNLVASNAVFNKCIFEGNIATGNPTGPYEGGGGGAIHISCNDPQTTSLGASEPIFINCGFYANTASGNTTAWGGAIVHLNDAGILHPVYVNCVFTDNQAQSYGGAVANFTRVISAPEGFTPGLEPDFTNCTFTENHAGQRGGALYNDGFLFMGSEILESRLENNIVWHNTASTEGPEIYSTGINFVTYSLIEASGGSGVGWDTDMGTDGGNNIDTDPAFVNLTDPVGADNIPGTSDDGLRLSMSSVAVNAGNNLAEGLIGISLDYIGSSRILSGQVDMGAYERSGIILPDFDLFWLDDWPDIDPPCLSCPLPWSILLAERIFQTPQFIWDDRAQFVIYDDYAIVSGTIMNYSDPNLSFTIYLKLVKPKDWNSWSANKGTYFALTREAMKEAKKEHFNWTYWQLSDESYLEGKGDLEGKLFLKHWPASHKTAIQMGKGANAWDSDLGIGGYFIYKGKLKCKGKKVALAGLGSLNVDAIPCENDCKPQPIENLTQYYSVKAASEVGIDEATELRIYPLPSKTYFTLDVNSLEPGIYTMGIFDLAGREKYTSRVNTVDGNPTIILSEFLPGVYIIKLLSEDKTTLIQKLVVE